MQSTEEFWSRKQFAEGSTNNIEHWLVARQRIGKCKYLSHRNWFLFVYNYYLFTIFVAGTLSSSNFVKFPALILKIYWKLKLTLLRTLNFFEKFTAPYIKIFISLHVEKREPNHWCKIFLTWKVDLPRKLPMYWWN